MDTLRGVIERITYHNEENGYTVAKLLPEFAHRTFGGPTARSPSSATWWACTSAKAWN